MSMKAVGVTDFGGPEALRILDLPVPQAGPREIRIQVTVAAVNAIVVPSETHGAYAQYLVVPAESVVRAPAGVTEAEAASLPMNALTARLACCRETRVR
jgi:NADPH:quinone reductase-like Zn-dependent oxidoreductase